jgi:phosphoribosylformylglycinamidine synthase subunit PurS
MGRAVPTRAPGFIEIQVGAAELIRARVTVTLKNGVLDPQGKAIEHALESLGFGGVGQVRQGKVFDIELGTSDSVQAEADLKAMCDRLLANTVIEKYAVELR